MDVNRMGESNLEPGVLVMLITLAITTQGHVLRIAAEITASQADFSWRE